MDTIIREHIVCADGFTMSVQASRAHYCRPRENGYEYYTHVEVGYPSQIPNSEGLRESKENTFPDENTPYTEAVYSYVPARVVWEEIASHDGMVSGGWSFENFQIDGENVIVAVPR